MAARAVQLIPGCPATRSGASAPAPTPLVYTPAELAGRWRVTLDHLYRQVIGRDLPAI
jgi:hypothetical protein